MAQKTNIEWTDAVWNPVTGCTKVSPGCKNCYAETIANRFWKDTIFEEKLPTGSLVRRGRKFTDVICHGDRLGQPLHWKKPRMIFVNSMSDLFHEDVPFEFIDKVFAIMHFCTQHIFQILTKRPERALKYITDTHLTHSRIDIAHFNLKLKNTPLRQFPLSNVWLGVSVENQKTADERIPLLLQTPAAVRWISAEPLLEKIDITDYWWKYKYTQPSFGKLHWVVVGGESGPKARDCHAVWILNLVTQCKASNVPVFVKQLGSKCVYREGTIQYKDAGSKGQIFEKFPEPIRVREYPKVI